jgi:hypothetical protein
MSDNKKIHNIENTDEWINCIEKSVVKEQLLNYYEYHQFSDIREIGNGFFGKVYRANWKNSNSKKQFALKSFFNLNNITIKEIICEVIYTQYIVFKTMFFF